MTTGAEITASNGSAASWMPLIDAVPQESTETRWHAESQPSTVSSAGDVRQTQSPLLTGRCSRVVEPLADIHGWLTDVPDRAVLLIYRAFLDCLNPR